MRAIPIFDAAGVRTVSCGGTDRREGDPPMVFDATVSASPLYARLLGPRWEELDPRVRRTHEVDGGARFHGTFRIERGRRLAARVLASAAGMPVAQECVATTLTIEVDGGAEHWHRLFGNHALDSTQGCGDDGLLVERFGRIEFRVRLEVERAGIRFRQVRACLCVGRLALALPRWLAPFVDSHETPGNAPGETRVWVSVQVPLVGLVMRYEGCIAREESRA